MEMVHFIPPEQRRLVMMAAQVDQAPVLILGPSGTGKSAITRWIHSHSARAIKPLLLASREEPLIDQLHRAQGGTLCIQELGEWSRADQKRILDFLKSRSLPHPTEPGLTSLVNVRIVATSSQLLEGRAQAGLFNAELLERMNVFRIEMPELRSRKDEIEDIAEGLLGEVAREIRKDYVRGIAADAWARIQAYDWPGNLRELRNILKIAVLKAEGPLLKEADLPDFEDDDIDFNATREEFEKTYITELLRSNDWQVDRTCEASRMDKKTLLEKMQRYGIATASP